MQEIQNKKKLLQTEINRIQSEMNSMKMQIPTEPLGCLDPKVLQQKVSSKKSIHNQIWCQKKDIFLSYQSIFLVFLGRF